MNAIALAVEVALAEAGIPNAATRLVLAPAWTTDWMTEEGREKLRAYGIAPARRRASRRALFGEDEAVPCPALRQRGTEKLSEFGSTSCKALWRCTACREPFDHFRCH
jgi:ring-1,2-phenylacetyl-CoA epoxidase subunit PaaD